MAKRTFFVLRVSGPAVSQVAVVDRVTYSDISSQLVVEQVAARMDGTKFNVNRMNSAFPSATAAARQYIDMQNDVRKDSSLRGPFKVQTEEEPSSEALVAWWYAMTGKLDSYHAAPPYGHPNLFAPALAGVALPMPTTTIDPDLFTQPEVQREQSRTKKARRTKGA